MLCCSVFMTLNVNIGIHTLYDIRTTALAEYYIKVK